MATLFVLCTLMFKLCSAAQKAAGSVDSVTGTYSKEAVLVDAKGHLEAETREAEKKMLTDAARSLSVSANGEAAAAEMARDAPQGPPLGALSPRPQGVEVLPSWQSGDASAGDAPAPPGDAWRPGAALDGPAAAVDVGGGGQRHIYSQKATFWHPNDVASWRTTCKEYWRVNSENLVDQFCNADSFAMAMRMKYGLKLEDPEHHWNGVGSPSVNEKRHRDFVEYMDECKQMNRAEESFADVSGFTEIAKKDLTDAVPPVQSAKSVQGSSRSRSGRRGCETCDRGLSCTHATLCEGESDEENKCDLENEDRKGCCYYKTYSCWDDDNEQIYF